MKVSALVIHCVVGGLPLAVRSAPDLMHFHHWLRGSDLALPKLDAPNRDERAEAHVSFCNMDLTV